MQKLKNNLPAILVLITMLPFLLLLRNIDWSLWSTDRGLFWDSFVFVVANLMGLLGGMFLYWQYILGVRFLARLFGENLIHTNKLHKALGKYGVIFVFGHVFLVRMKFLQEYIWIVTPDFSSTFETYVSLGRIAYFTFWAVWISSALLRGRIKYRPWRYIHYLTFPLLLFVFLHSRAIGSNILTNDALALIWNIMYYLFIFIFVFRVLRAVGLGAEEYKLVARDEVGDNINIYTFKPTKAGMKPKIGQYAYMKTDLISASHPFTVMDYDPETEEVKFGIKSEGKFTEKLLDYEIGDTIRLAGPYGAFTKEGQNEKPKVLIAGGIGITPFIRLIREYGQDTILINCNRTLEDAIYRNDLVDILGDNYYDVLSKEETTGRNIINSRCNAEVIEQVVGKDNLENYNYFLCASPGFLDSLKKDLKELGIPAQQIYLEEFSI
ncbi:ferric reductase-like transmembrane domain-containing protein [Candidatus Dojkabacteria bacterium]|uniref:Ferric reductase-like transmembrane domain-containing protein n=1 Tax=Candidatus Dojkabacteria bacterium TaxID=2099670 RepID=A0A955L5C0_9BACT|nr:ferric reductase-like transmembrane domain-containing protein [Candidatus Dojkabacteria bacterium]